MRLRGAVHGECELPLPPRQAEIMKVNDDWYRISNVMWAVAIDATTGEQAGWDVAVILASAPEPNRENWVQPDGD